MGKGKLLRKGMAMLLAVVMIIGFLPGVGSLEVSAAETGTSETTITPSAPETGDGTADKPYQIGTAEELYWFAGLVNGTLDGVAMNTSANAVLTEDIIVNKNVLKSDGTVQDGTFKDWEPIGAKYSYEGIFDGQNHTVSGLYFNDETADDVGLFGWVKSEGKVENVGVLDSYFKGNERVGGICGYNNGMLEKCYNGGIVSGSQIVGGICGNNEGICKNSYNTGIVSSVGNGGCVGGVCGVVGSQSTTTNCYNMGAVSGSQMVGGVCGCARGGGNTIKNCYNTGVVKGTSAYVGGVCGVVNSQDTTTNCYNTGIVSGGSESFYIGGVCGGNMGTTTNCYNIGTVNGSEYVGGVCGYNMQGTITNCYYDSEVYVKAAIGENTNDETVTKVEGKTTEQFASGEVAYLLQEGQENSEEPVWGQTLADDNKQTSPVLGGKEVYKVKRYLGCIDASGEVTDGYSNSPDDILYEPHRYENGICSFCRKAYQEAVLTTDKYDIDGDDTPEDVYEISNAGQLYWFADKVNKDGDANAILIEDIIVNTDVLDKAGNLNDTSKFIAWTPIGTGDKPFTGIFDGQNHTISGLYFNDETNYVGLFGRVESGGKVANVGIRDSYFSGNYWIGGICGNNNGMIENCYNEGIVSGSQLVGGVCGENRGTCKNSYNTGTVSGGSESFYIGGVCGKNTKLTENCHNTGAVSGSGHVGGVCGGAEESTTTNCYNTGSVSGDSESNYVGGVCGSVNLEGTTTTNCYNTGAVSGCMYVGGVCGNNCQGTTTNCYNIGAVNGSEKVGGVCGNHMQGTTTNCYNIGAVNGSENVGGVCGNNYQGTITNCYYDSEVYVKAAIGESTNDETVTKVEGKTTEQFASGEVAYLLQEGQTDVVWGQKIDSDDSPVLGGSKVYKKNKYSGCKENPGNVASDVYSNADNDEYAPHTDDGKAVGSVAYDNRCDFCGKELHSFNEDGSCKDAGCVYHKGSITNVSCPTKIVYSGDVANAEPKVSDFTVASGKEPVFTWYQGNVTNGNLPTDSLGAVTPKEVGTYTLVVKAAGAERGGIIYTTAELRVLVTIEKEAIKNTETEPKKEETTTPQPSGTTTAQQPSGTTTAQQPNGTTAAQPPKNGDVVTDEKTKAKFEVTDVTKKEVIYNAPADEKAKDITVPDTVTINGEVYKVTKISDNAFKGNKTVTSITIGSNIQTIGKNAFSGCKKLKTIVIKSKTLTDKKIAKNAFKGISKKTVIKVPKKKMAAYKKLLKKKGLSSKNKVKGY